jgi:putative membrane protein
MPFLLIIAIALAALTALFAIQNSGVITVSFLGWEWDASLALILILTLGTGIVIGYLAGLPSSLKKGSQLRQVKRDLGALEETEVNLSPPPEEDRESAI